MGIKIDLSTFNEYIYDVNENAFTPSLPLFRAILSTSNPRLNLAHSSKSRVRLIISENRTAFSLCSPLNTLDPTHRISTSDYT